MDFRSPFSALLRGYRARAREGPSWWQAMSAAQVFVLSFLALVALGTLGFQVLPGLYTGEGLSWSSALFTATSAVCVTGLIVVDTATYFTGWGQAYVLLLIQLGGLGMITFSTLVMQALRVRLSLRHASLAYGTSGLAPAVDQRRLTRDVLLFTLGVEALGALALYLVWLPDFGARGALWPAVFHSVSAFCNAGFSTFTPSLIGYAGAPAVLGVVMLLIVVGGLGFLVLEELFLFAARPRGPRRYRVSVHTRLVLVTTGGLLLVGWGAFTLFEWNVTFAGFSVTDKLVNGLFLSATARTAGFNTIDYAHAASNTNFLTILLMSIGGSPGSTAGGLKTTTFALIGLLAWARLRGRGRVYLWGRVVPRATVQQAMGLFVIAFTLVTVSIFLLTSSEIAWVEGVGETRGAPAFLALMFEAVSAFNTVGLSMGATGTLTEVGRFTTVVLMFVGRVGTLTFAAALARPEQTPLFEYASEDVGIG